MIQRGAAPAPAAAGGISLGTALGLALLPVLPFALGQLLLLAGGRIAQGPSQIILALSLTLAGWAAWRAAASWMAPAAMAAIAVVSTLLCAVVFDTSFDGQDYHFEAIDALARGWNPFYDAPGAASATPKTIFSRHYPAGLWVSSAVQIAGGLTPEAAKNQALIIAAALLLAVSGVARTFGLGAWRSAAAGVLVAANPILLVQLFTRMNDGLLGICLALTAAFSVLWILRPRWWAAVGAAAPLLLALNLKFSALPITVGLCALICLFAVTLSGWRAALRIAGVLLLAGVAGLVVLGAHPYVTNILRQSHPFYPVMGPGAVEIMSYNRPPAFAGLSPAEQLTRSYFGPTSSGYVERPPFKPPFAISKDELRQAGEYDSRIGGFGPLFSGALVLAALLAAASGLQPARPVAVTRLLAGAAGMLLLTLVMPEAWWARYTPQAWWVVVLIALAALMSNRRALQVGGGVLALVLLANAALTAASSAYYVGKRNLEIRQQIAEIGRRPGTVCVTLANMQARRPMLEGLGDKVRFLSKPPRTCDLTPLAGAFPHIETGYCACP